MSNDPNGTLFYGFTQEDLEDESWEEASTTLEDGKGKFADEVRALLREKGVELRTFGWENGYFWYALSILKSELDFDCSAPKYVTSLHFVSAGQEFEWSTTLRECAVALKIDLGESKVGWYIGCGE